MSMPITCCFSVFYAFKGLRSINACFS